MGKRQEEERLQGCFSTVAASWPIRCIRNGQHVASSREVGQGQED